MGFSVMLWGAEKLVPAEYWCPYGTYTLNIKLDYLFYLATKKASCLLANSQATNSLKSSLRD